MLKFLFEFFIESIRFMGIQFYSIPILLLLFIAVSLYRYMVAKKKNQETPDTYSPAELKKRKTLLIVVSVVFGVFVAVVIGFMMLLYVAATNM